jgi:hypothetical protein
MNEALKDRVHAAMAKYGLDWHAGFRHVMEEEGQDARSFGRPPRTGESVLIAEARDGHGTRRKPSVGRQGDLSATLSEKTPTNDSERERGI